MKLYIAGNSKEKGGSARDYAAGARNRLLSFFFLNDWAKDEFRFWVNARPEGVSVLLDSGAFSAHTLKGKVDLMQYCEYIEEHREALAAYIALDVIGDAAASFRNLDTMRARGLDPVPVYHPHEPLSVLDELLSDLVENPVLARYIAIGGVASQRLRRAQLQPTLDRVFAHLRRSALWSELKVHGLGVMAQWALERYPFFSVDSSSAIRGAGMGRVQRFEFGVMVSRNWSDDIALVHDRLVADRISPMASDGGSAHVGRRQRNIEAVLRLQEHVTALWESPRMGSTFTELARPRTRKRAPITARAIAAENVVIYRGPSQFTGEPVMACVSRTTNAKTGPVLQVWILRSDMDPVEAVTSGADGAVCGDCALRGDGRRRPCYVNIGTAPRNIYHKIRRGLSYMAPSTLATWVAGQRIRFGAYGDPCAVPLDVWRPLIEAAKSSTGFTHAWRTCDAEYRSFLMASVESEAERQEAHLRGWRTYRVRTINEPLAPAEIICPGSEEGQKVSTCYRCGLCDGTATPTGKSVAIIAHGAHAKWFTLRPVGET